MDNLQKDLQPVVKDDVLHLTGKTYPHKEAIKSVGGKWNAITKSWEIALDGRSVQEILLDIHKEELSPHEREQMWIQRMIPKWETMVRETPFSENYCSKRIHGSHIYRDGYSFLSGPTDRVYDHVAWGDIYAKYSKDGFTNLIFGITYD